jgi:hypothetical protein
MKNVRTFDTSEEFAQAIEDNISARREYGDYRIGRFAIDVDKNHIQNDVMKFTVTYIPPQTGLDCIEIDFTIDSEGRLVNE